MIIQKIKIFFPALACAFILLNAVAAFGQFTGSVSLGGYRSSNVEGRDSATPDFVFNPSFNLNYYWNISDPALLKFETVLSPNLYKQVDSRSYFKSYFAVTGAFYLSNIDETVTPLRVPVKTEPPPQVNKPVMTQADTIKKTVTIKEPVPLKPTPEEIQDIASEKLSDLSELLDSFDINKKGLNTKQAEAASDLKDSVSESVLALSDILSTQVYTESISEVVMTELLAQKKIFSQVPMEAKRKDEVIKDFEDIINSLKVSSPQSDVLPVPKPVLSSDTPMPITRSNPTPDTKEMVEQALVHLQTAKKDNASVITLINSQTSFGSLSSSDISVKEDLYSKSKTTYTTLLTTPLSLELQNNRTTYLIYSYSLFNFHPRLDLYSGDNFGFGISYNLSRTIFPNDSTHVNDGTEHIFRLDSRIGLSSALALTFEGGMNIRGYDHPIQYIIQLPGKKTTTINTLSNYSHFFFGGGFMIFPSERLSIGAAMHLTRSSELRPYLSDLISSNSRISGSANIDEYSYDETRETIFALWRIFWDIDLALDFSYENRQYANLQIPKRLQQVVNADRVDHGPQFGLSLSREFLFDSRLISIFDSFSPAFDIQYSDYTSTLKTFSYKDVTTSFSFVFGF